MRCWVVSGCALLFVMGGCSSHCGKINTQATVCENTAPEHVPLYHVVAPHPIKDTKRRKFLGGTGFMAGEGLGLCADHGMPPGTKVYFQGVKVDILDRGAAPESGDDWLLVSLPDDFAEEAVELGPPGPPPLGSILTVVGYPWCDFDRDAVHDTASLIEQYESCPERRFACEVVADPRDPETEACDGTILVMLPDQSSRDGLSGAPVFHDGKVIALWVGSGACSPYPFADTFLERWFTRKYGLIRLIPDSVRQLCDEKE